MYKKLKVIIIFFIIAVIIAFFCLNMKKYSQLNNNVLPVWSSHDEEYYENSNNINISGKIKEILSPERLIYGLTRIRMRAPLTYLKREIPLLSYYTPKEIKRPTETIYNEGNENNHVIQLKFSLKEESKKNIETYKREEIKENPVNNRVGQKREEPQIIEEPGHSKIPTIAIYHSHTSETYFDDPRHQDNNVHVLPGNIGNVGKIGIELARILSEKYKYKVIHTTKIHDQSYSRSYYNSRLTVKELVKNYPDLDLILDLHRDGIKADVSQDDISVVINNKRIAVVMIVIAKGTYHYIEKEVNSDSSDWRDNLNLANSLADKMNLMYPGLLRRVEIRDTTTNRYNQDLSPNSILIEIGDFRNTTQEAIYAARLVADAIASLYND